MAEPLHPLTKKDVPFEWTDETEATFQSLKEALIKPVMLAYPQVEGGMFILDTDASGTAIGAVLSQVQDGEECLLAYGSRCLSSMERNYCTTRRELLAVVHFVEYYRHYLLGRKVLVRTDHGSLRWLKNMKAPTGQVARWIEWLAPFDWDIQHRVGVRHQKADAMSWMPFAGDCKQCRKLNELTGEVTREAPKGRDPLPDYSDQPVIVNQMNVAERDGRGRRRWIVRRRRRDEAVMAGLPRLRDIDEVAIATRADPTLGKLLA